MKKEEKPHNPFAFLHGDDEEFNQAMKEMNQMSEGVWKTDSKVDGMMETLQENNKSIQSIDQMHKAIFQTD